MKYRILLAGNPNCGKSTIFNALAFAHAKVGNYPGVTVEKKSASVKIDGAQVEMEDLPGIYSMSASSIEEEIASEAISNTEFDLVLNVIDSTALERSLYFTMQLIKMGIPTMVVLNMTDEMNKSGKFIDEVALSKELGVPVVKCTAHNSTMVKALKEKMMQVLKEKPEVKMLPTLSKNEFLSKKIAEVERIVSESLQEDYRCWANWMAVKLLCNDRGVMKQIEEKTPIMAARIREIGNEIKEETGESAVNLIASERFKFIEKICATCVKTRVEKNGKFTMDSILLNRFLGLPIFFFLMYLIFQFSFTLADPFMGMIEDACGALGEWVGEVWSTGEDGSFLKDLVVDGIIAGVGGVFVFFPNILMLFFALTLLEESGYMARAGMLCDRIIRRCGIGGSSVIPLLMGFGCAVPAIIGTRTMKSRTERLTTILVTPLMSCGARLPVYALMIPAFFAESYRGLVMFALYMTGIVMALFCAKLLRLTAFKGEGGNFVIELPPYRIPRIKNLLSALWQRSYAFLKKAATIILALSIILWFCSTYPEKEELSANYDAQIEALEKKELSEDEKGKLIADIENNRHSEAFEYTVMGRIGGALEPIFKPLGFDKPVISALVGAIAAKEVFVSQLGIIYGVGDEIDEGSESETSKRLQEKLSSRYSGAQAVSILLFVLLSMPCAATLATTYAETNSVKLAISQAIGLTLVAYMVCLVFYQTAVRLF